MNIEKTFEEKCYDFQQNLINVFNNEQDFPFLIKYFLIKEIWEDIQNQKSKMNEEMYNKIQNQQLQQENLSKSEI